MPIEQVVIAYNFSLSGRSALDWSIVHASRGNVTLHFVCVLEPHTTFAAVPRLPARADYQYASDVQAALVERITGELRAAAIEQVEFFVHVRIGKPADQILALATEVGADTIIIGTKGLTGLERIMLGSVAERVVREAGCPVEVARPKRYAEVERLHVREVDEVHHLYVPPHRYSYQTNQLQLRPADWPLY